MITTSTTNVSVILIIRFCNCLFLSPFVLNLGGVSGCQLAGLSLTVEELSHLLS